MKMSETLFRDLRDAINAVGGIAADASVRARWDQLWRSDFDTGRLYEAGLKDEHIDTALRRIARETNGGNNADQR